MAGITDALRVGLQSAQQEALSAYEDCAGIDRVYAQSSEVSTCNMEWVEQAIGRAIMALLDAKLELKLIEAGHYSNLKTNGEV